MCIFVNNIEKVFIFIFIYLFLSCPFIIFHLLLLCSSFISFRKSFPFYLFTLLNLFKRYFCFQTWTKSISFYCLKSITSTHLNYLFSFFHKNFSFYRYFFLRFITARLLRYYVCSIDQKENVLKKKLKD